MAAHDIEASVGQRLLWFLDRYRGAEGALNCPMLCRLRGPLDPDRLTDALDQVVRRHDALRSTFTRRGRDLVQRIAEPAPPEVALVDVAPDDLDAAIAKELATPIDAALHTTRVTLWRVAPDDHVLCLNMHHLVTDSWSCGIVFEDLCAALDRGAPDAEPGWSYARFARHQAEVLSGPALRAEQEHWRDRLAGMSLPALPLRDGTARQTALERGELPAATVTALGGIARTRRTTLFAVLLTLYYARLQAVTGQDDLTVASLFANRPRPEVRRTVGFLANMVLLRGRFDPGWTFAEALAATNATVADGLVHQGVPFQLLPVRPVNQGRPDDVVFQLLADPIYRTVAGGLDIEVLVPDGVGSRFEFELVLVPDADRLRTLLFYNRARLDQGFARDFVTRFVEAANRVAVDPTIPLRSIR